MRATSFRSATRRPRGSARSDWAPRRSGRFRAVSEYEMPDRRGREPSVEDVRQLMGASTPHFALQIRNRIARLIRGLPHDHPARIEGEREIARLTDIAYGGESRGAPGQEHERPLPSVRLAEER